MAAHRWDWSACCACTCWPTGLTWAMKLVRMRSTTSLPSAISAALTWGASAHPMPPRCSTFATCWKGTSWGAVLFAKVGELLLASGHEALRGHHRRGHADRGTTVDEEPRAKPRPGDASK